MIFSMTGFASVSGAIRSDGLEVELSIEVKTLNSKYLDLQFRLPRAYNVLERDLAQIVRDHLKRGRVEVSIYRRVLQGPVQELAVNIDQAQALANAFKRVEEAVKMPTSLTLRDLLSQPDWLQAKDPEVDRSAEWPTLSNLLKKAMTQVIEARASEGESLKKILAEHRKLFEKTFREFSTTSANAVGVLRERWKKRIKELAPDLNLDANRLEQELVLFVARADYQEEVDRIEHHLQTFDKMISNGGELGRKFDFLLQELHREVNTLGSKCDQKAMTEKVVEMKSFLEKMKEQVQNVE